MADSAEPVLRRLASGDRDALSDLYDRYAGLVQEVFVQVWRQADRFDPARGTPGAWLCTIARTRALDRLRRRVARKEEQGDAIPGLSERPRREEGIAVRKALDGLTQDQRRALELAYYEGLTQTEIAQRLGEPLGTIKTRIRTAMIRLRETLGPEP